MLQPSLKVAQDLYGGNRHWTIPTLLGDLAAALWGQGRFEEAEQTALEAIAVCNGQNSSLAAKGEALVILSCVHQQAGRQNEAVDAAGRAVEAAMANWKSHKVPSNKFRALDWVANELINRGSLQVAVPLLEKALDISLSSNDPAIRNKAGFALLQLGFTRLVAAAPDDRLALYESLLRKYRGRVNDRDFVLLAVVAGGDVGQLKGIPSLQERQQLALARVGGAMGLLASPDVPIPLVACLATQGSLWPVRNAKNFSGPTSTGKEPTGTRSRYSRTHLWASRLTTLSPGSFLPLPITVSVIRTKMHARISTGPAVPCRRKMSQTSVSSRPGTGPTGTSERLTSCFALKWRNCLRRADGTSDQYNDQRNVLLAYNTADRERYRTAVRFCTEAFKDDTKLAAQHRYNAACLAALAAAGKGKDANGLAENERAPLRKQALGWLHADLKAYSACSTRNPKPGPLSSNSSLTGAGMTTSSACG